MSHHRPLLDPSPLPSPPPDGSTLPDPIPSSILKAPSRRTSSIRSVADAVLEDLHISHSRRPSVSFDNTIINGDHLSGLPRQPTTKLSASERGSLRELRDDDARFVFVNDAVRTNAPPARFPKNAISTAKYSPLTFIPRNLYEQFHRVAYIYFLVLAALNQVPQLGVFTPAASILPLAFVLGVTALKDAYEDFRRHRSDRSENSREARVLVNGEFAPKQWKEIQVGEVIRIASNETLPCDMVLLATSDSTGVAYVQTINLDGESNLKTRYAKQETMSTAPVMMSGTIRCEQPNRNIYGFVANYTDEVHGGRRIPLGPSNILLRGCELKNTEWAIGVAVYTGKDTKVMMNSAGAPSKRSRLETLMNRETLLLAAILVALCSTVALLAGIWLTNHSDELDDMPFYRKSDFSDKKPSSYKWYGMGWTVVFTFMQAVIQFQVMVPIALFISMELVRVGQAYFMAKDKEMFDADRGAAFQCRALNINEDLGQIKYVFSDKTGTLTENKMEFRCASIYGGDYPTVAAAASGNAGNSVVVDDLLLRPKVIVRTNEELMKKLKNGDVEDGARAHHFFLTLATCNTIVPIMVDTEQPGVKLIEYQGESPDEQALVYAAAAYGFTLIERTAGHIIIDVFGQRQRYDVLGLHEFDSDRKRMSVIIGCPDKSVKLFVKGADSSMLGIVDKSLNSGVVEATESHLHSYSSLGLRTLVIGMRDLSSREFEEWQTAYERASSALLGRGGLLRSVAANVEQNLRLLGASGIEDKLQKGVPEAIESLRQAGIKVWVLTGDKQETAISIGFSCKLLTRDMSQIVINSHSLSACKKSIEEAAAAVKQYRASDSSVRQLALIIDGNSLVYILETALEEQLFEIATACDVVVCCRVAPLQKAGIVALIKNRTDAMTLAIGDGANDVSMIQMADVGIGISGQEGRQAVMASDFAMGQFRFLVPLLLVHGHWNYQRMAYMILYNLYRNAAFVFVLFWYILYTGFTLTTAITEWSSVLYSVIYTAVPTIVVAILDKDLSRRTLLKYPQLYGSGQRDEKYNMKQFVPMMVDALWQSLAAFYIPFFAYRESTVDGSALGDLLILGVVLLVNIHLALDVVRWNWVTHVAVWGSVVATLACVMIIDSIPILPGYWAVYDIMGHGLFWLLLLAVMVAGMIPHFILKAVTEHFLPNDVQIAREMEKMSEEPVSTAPRPSTVELSTAQRP